MKNTALIISGLIFTFVAIIHMIRYVKGWEITIAHYAIPLNVSIYGAVVGILLAIWMFASAFKE